MRTIPCPKCERLFENKNSLAQHLKDRHDTGAEPDIFYIDDADIHTEYGAAQFSVGIHDDDY